MKAIQSSDAPAAIGPYSQAIVAGGLVYCSGQVSLDAASGQMVGNDVASQTEKCLQNLFAVLTAAGSAPNQVVKCTVFLKDMNDFSAMNEVYAKYFDPHKPARAAVEVSRLPKDALVEIDAIAVVK
jgi:2-iminobutanoate/2-iminopropanoate deaminase